MPFLNCLLLFSFLGVGGYLGEITPVGSLAKYHSPSPYLSIYFAYPSFISPELSFSLAQISGKFSSPYALNQKELRFLLFIPTPLKRDNRNISLITGIGTALWERRLSANKERSYYPDFYLGLGYGEKVNRVRFRINLLPNIIVESGKKGDKNLTNFYWVLKAELGVGYE